MADISTLVQDIQGLFSGHIFDPGNLSKFSSTIESVLAHRFAEYGEDRKPYLRLSNVGRPLRQLWFELKSGLVGEALSPSTKMKFLFGDFLEALLIALAIEAGHEVTGFQKEVSVDGVKGRLDVYIDTILIDCKSASSFSFKKFLNGGLRSDDPFGYIGQLAGYSAADGDPDAAFFVIDKTLGHICLDRYSKEELQEYDIRRRIPEVRKVLSKEQPPSALCYEPEPEGKSGNFRLPVGCSYCPHKFNCYEQQGVKLRTFYYANGPVYLTHVAKEPRVQEVTPSQT